MSIEQQSALASESRWADEAGRLLANLGFTLVNSDHPGAPGAAYLVVALRDQPTLRHFDPEEITYWVIEAGRGRLASIDRDVAVAPAPEHAWGRITLTDRLGVRNQFLTFGGSLRVQALDPSTLAVGFASPVPILRWSGHSQGLDPLTAEVGAFFGRMMVPIDFNPGAEHLVSAASPLTLYAAFVQDVRERFIHSEALREAHVSIAGWGAREEQRLEADAPDDWAAASELRRQLGLAAA